MSKLVTGALVDELHVSNTPTVLSQVGLRREMPSQMEAMMSHMCVQHPGWCPRLVSTRNCPVRVMSLMQIVRFSLESTPGFKQCPQLQQQQTLRTKFPSREDHRRWKTSSLLSIIGDLAAGFCLPLWTPDSLRPLSS